jgi:hypothetical protein
VIFFELVILGNVVALPGDSVETIRRTEHIVFANKEGVICKNNRGALAY